MKDDEKGPLAWCQHCGALKRVAISERWKGSSGAVLYGKGRCEECGGSTLAVTIGGSHPPEAVAWKVTISSARKRDVMKKRLQEVAEAKGLASISPLVELAVETFLYGREGGWLDDPYLDDARPSVLEQ